MKPKMKDKVLNKAKSLFNRHNRSSSQAPSEHSPASSVAASASSPSGVYLEPSRISSKERSSFSSATPSRSSSVVPSAVNTPLPSEAKPESSNSPQLCQIPAYHFPQDSPSSNPSSEPLATPERQPMQCSLDPQPSVFVVITSPEAQVFPETLQSTPTPLSDLWSRAIDEAKGEIGTLKWLQQHGLVSTDGTQQMNQKSAKIVQSRTDKINHMEELISLIEANKLSEQNDKPLKISIGNREVIVRDYIANTVAFITKIGDVAFSLAPGEASTPWAISKAVLKVSLC